MSTQALTPRELERRAERAVLLIARQRNPHAQLTVRRKEPDALLKGASTSGDSEGEAHAA